MNHVDSCIFSFQVMDVTGGRLDGLEPVVLESEEDIISVLTATHISPDSFHYDTQQMTDIISAQYYWPDMSNRIKAWVDACEECAKMDNGISGDACGAPCVARASQKINKEVTEVSHVVREAEDAELKASTMTNFKKHMSSENGGNYLQCPYCYFQCNTKSSFQIHVGSQHPLHCDDVSVGRLGKVIFYQRTAKLFHCYICFFTAKDYTKLFDHLLVKHCFSSTALGLQNKVHDAQGECSVNKESKDLDSLEVGHGEVSEKVPSPKMQPDNLVDVDTKVSFAGDPLKMEEGQSFEGGALNGSNEDSTFSGSSSKRKRSSASCSEEEDDEEEDDDELDSSQAAKEEKNAAVLKYTEHLSTRYYYCKFCKWRSKKKGFLLYHVSHKHEVPKPHACKECKKTFMLETLLTKHVKLCHKQGLYQCPFCPFESNFLRGIRRHLNNCRGEEEGEAEGQIAIKEKE